MRFGRLWRSRSHDDMMSMTPEDWFALAPEPWLALWGKARPGPVQKAPAHPLLFHLIDVMVVSELLLEERIAPALKRRMATALGLAEADAARTLSMVVACHDLGKATPSFQRMWDPAVAGLSANGLPFPRRAPRSRHHGALSMQLARRELAELMPDWLARRLARATAAHHGEFPSDMDFTRPVLPDEDGGPAWAAARQELADQLTRIVGASTRVDAASRSDHALTVLAAGLVAVADWVGSMAEVFRYEPPDMPIGEYEALARTRAQEALSVAGFSALSAPTQVSFAARFGTPPWPLHEAIERLSGDLDGPAMVVIEAPMGEGKTEAALFLSEAFAIKAGQQGLFFGLPTQATANQMLGRVERFLADRPGPPGAAQLVLTHGQALLSRHFERLLSGVYDERTGGSVRAERWFVSRKRTLLAGTAVGTIDQALLGVLRIRHGFVRLFGLAGKVVVFDEVHAYDTYTSELILRLAEWLHALGASVIILSATLPSHRRQALLGSMGGGEIATVAYPRVSVARNGRVEVTPIRSRRPALELGLDHMPDDLDAVGQRLISAIQDGGCAGWVRNTIARAQEAFQWALSARTTGALPHDTQVLLLHSRFPAIERQQREAILVEWLGRGGRRPARALVIGTQVFEQSIDIDFDILATDLAPVDLVLQRAGRLHRHDGRERPATVASPRLVVAGTGVDQAPEWARRGIVYAAFPQLRTFAALRERTSIRLPDEIEPLVEGVYAEVHDGDSEQIQAAAHRQSASAEKDELLAARRLMPAPNQVDDPFRDFVAHLEEDNPELHEALQARTRLGADGLTVVFLHEHDGQLYLDAECTQPTTLTEVAGMPSIRALLDRGVTISHRGLVPLLARADAPSAWRDVGLLADKRVLVLRDRECALGRFALKLDADLGLLIATEETAVQGDDD